MGFIFLAETKKKLFKFRTMIGFCRWKEKFKAEISILYTKRRPDTFQANQSYSWKLKLSFNFNSSTNSNWNYPTFFSLSKHNIIQ